MFVRFELVEALTRQMNLRTRGTEKRAVCVYMQCTLYLILYMLFLIQDLGTTTKSTFQWHVPFLFLWSTVLMLHNHLLKVVHAWFSNIRHGILRGLEALFNSWTLCVVRRFETFYVLSYLFSPLMAFSRPR